MIDLSTNSRPAFDALQARVLDLRNTMMAASNPFDVLTGGALEELHELASKAQDESVARLAAFRGAADHVADVETGSDIPEDDAERSPKEVLERAIGREALAQAELLKAAANLSLAQAQFELAQSNAGFAHQDRELAEISLRLREGNMTQEELEAIMDQVVKGLDQNIERLEA